MRVLNIIALNNIKILSIPFETIIILLLSSSSPSMKLLNNIINRDTILSVTNF